MDGWMNDDDGALFYGKMSYGKCIVNIVGRGGVQGAL